MNLKEFSNEFDIFYNNIMSNKAPGLDEYEKSVFLTKAQEDIIKELYTGKNKFLESFEKTEEIRNYLDSLIITYSTFTEPISDGLTSNSSKIELPKELWYIIYEWASFSHTDCLANSKAIIIPVRHDDVYRIMQNPFRKHNKRRVLRLNISDKVIELISEYSLNKYYVRYIKKPSPIILEDLPEGISIDGISKHTDCKLHEALHRMILERAVRLALISQGAYSNANQQE